MACRPSWEWLSALILCLSTLYAQSHILYNTPEAEGIELAQLYVS